MDLHQEDDRVQMWVLKEREEVEEVVSKPVITPFLHVLSQPKLRTWRVADGDVTG